MKIEKILNKKSLLLISLSRLYKLTILTNGQFIVEEKKGLTFERSEKSEIIRNLLLNI